MRPISVTRFAALTLPVLLIAACGGGNDGPTSPGGPCNAGTLHGTMTATVNGDAFTAGFLSSATIQNGTALGPNIVQVNGVACPVGGPVPRQILITLGRLTPITPGTYDLSAAAQQQPPQSGYSGIGQVVVAPNLWYTNISSASGAGSGTITITSITTTRVTGTFTLVAVPTGSNAASARDQVTVTNGVFDLTVP